MIRTAEILCVGTELLLGEVVNTNASHISKKLAEYGVSVYRHTVVGDNPERLSGALELALSRSDLVVMSGGLGPTYDDLTKETVASHFGLKMHVDRATEDAIKAFFASRGKGLCTMTKNNLKQAEVPDGATVIPNPNGTAPGIIIEKDGKAVIMLPGPPRELCPLVDGAVSEYLKKNTECVLVSHNLHIIGMGESAVEDALRELMMSSENPTVAPYAGDGETRLRVTAKARSSEEGEKLCTEMIEKIMASPVGRFVYGIDVGSTERALINALKEAGLTVSTAESCTGGLIAKRITDVSGASEVYMGSCVTYANEAKVKLVGVSEETLKKHGAVSEETAKEMARGVRLALETDIGIATTGIAGPGGGTPEKPVGTIYVGISSRLGDRAVNLKLSPMRSRDFLRTCTAGYALSMALDEVLKITK